MTTGLRDYALVTARYWAFTVTDGSHPDPALFHTLGYGPFALASLFLFCEFFGIVTNLLGGWLGARYGLRRTLTTGLFLQIAACSILAFCSEALSAGCGEMSPVPRRGGVRWQPKPPKRSTFN